MRKLSADSWAWLAMTVFSVIIIILGIITIPIAASKPDKQEIANYNELLKHYNNDDELKMIKFTNLSIDFDHNTHVKSYTFNERLVEDIPKLFKVKAKHQDKYHGDAKIVHFPLKDISVAHYEFCNVTYDGLKSPYVFLDRKDSGIIIGVDGSDFYSVHPTQALHGVYIMSVTNPAFYLYADLQGHFSRRETGWLALGSILLILGIIGFIIGIIFMFRKVKGRQSGSLMT